MPNSFIQLPAAGTGAKAKTWQSTQGADTVETQYVLIDGLPTFTVLTPLSSFAANRLHFVLHNSSTTAVVRLRTLVWLPQSTAVTGVLSSEWVLQRRPSISSAPSGGNPTSIVEHDTAEAIPTGIAAYSIPTAPIGGTPAILMSFIPQPDEVKLSTVDASTSQSLYDFAGLMIYDSSRMPGAKPPTIRNGQTLEVAQTATAGTGNCRILAVFTVET